MNIGIDLGGSHIGVGIIDEKYNIIDKKEHNWSENEKKALLTSIEIYSKQLINDIINTNKNINIDKIGIGFPGSNIVDGIVTKYGKTINLPKILSEEFNVPVYLKNDVKCSAMCEKNIGNLKKYSNCIFMTLGTGIGGAYFYKDKLVVPNKYQGFEIGHTTIEVDGRICKCGRRGCFEEYASMRVFRKEIEELFEIERVTSHIVIEIVESKKKEKEVNEIIDRYIKYLCTGLINIINVFEPDAICIGGSFTYYESIFMSKLKEKIKEEYKNNREIPDIIIAKYENDAGIIGASMLESNN